MLTKLFVTFLYWCRSENDDVGTDAVKQTWTDVMLKWDPRLYGGVQQIRVPVGKIWKPDIVLYN